jgi:hypothetical protein
MTSRRLAQVLVAVAAAVAGLVVAPAIDQTAHATPLNYKHLAPIQKRTISGTLAYAIAPHHATRPGGDDDGPGADGLPENPPAGYGGSGGSGSPGNYYPQGGNAECALHFGHNIKVNQNCLNIADSALQGRSQANNETSIAQDPMNPRYLVASDNDYVRGDGTCGAAYSLDGGQHWSNSTVPDSFTYGNGTPREYWQAGGDTSVAFDTRGNAYLSCQLFNRGAGTSPNPDESSAFVVFRSTGNHGASWNFPGRYTTVNFDPAGSSGVLEDKALMTVDNNPSSPYRDRIYVTWTEYAADGSAYIWEVHSDDYGETFSSRVLVSEDSPLCPNNYGLGTPHGNCNENQFSDPFVGPDGSLYVAYNNYNNAVTGNDNRNQFLLSKSTDGGNSFSPPVKVSDYYDLPDCQTYQGDDFGRACVPEKGSSTKSVFRATNYASGAVDPNNPNRVAVNFGSYINKYSNESTGCAPDGLSPATGQDLYTGVKTYGACANKILVSVSTDGGATFTGTTTDPRDETVVNQNTGQRHTDQFWQWSAYSPKGELAVSYYDRQYGNDEFNGSSDFSLSGSKDLTHFSSVRVTTSSMPAPTQFYGTNGGLFYGDYTGLTAVKGAHPIWSDTRNVDLFLCPGTGTPGNPPQLCTGTEPNGQQANDEEIYTDTLQVPSSGHHGRH